MRTLILSLALLVVCSTESQAASRTWKDRKGNEIKAEFTGGVLNNKIVLKASGNRRIYVRLSELSLEDRDYLVEQLTAKDNQKDLDMLKALMLSENQVPFIDPDAPKTNPTTGGGNVGSHPGAESGNPFNPLENPSANNQPAAEVPTEMYGLPLPSQELLMDDPVRAWTSLTGLKQMASFDRVLAPGFLRLKKADGTKGTFALVNFTKADIDYVKEALQKDMAREVFPEGNGFQSLTPEDIAKGYKVWTDRKNVPLIGKFIAVKTKNVVIEVNGEQREYPKAGLSQADRDWVDAEIKRQQDAAAQQRQANAQNRAPFGSTDTGEGSGSGRRFGIYYKHTCPICGKRWDDDSPFTKCSDCVGKTQYRCFRCLHTFVSTEANPKCPHCAQKDAEFARNTGYPPTTSSTASSSHAQNPSSSYTLPPSSTSTSSPSSFGSSSTSGGDSGSSSGVLMTILYVTMGLGLLGGIAAGLFKAFG